MVRIGLTGGPGSGKSTVAKIFIRRGVKVIDLDYLARLAVKPGKPAYKKIVEKFGLKAVSVSGELDRTYLRGRLICNPEEKKYLENIIHPEVFNILEKDLLDAEKAGLMSIAVESPLLFETDMIDMFDIVVTVFVSYDIQLERLMMRDGVSVESASGLIGSQISLDKKAALSDYIISNDKGMDELEIQVGVFFEKYGIIT